MNDLLQAFEVATKADWQRQVQKELSGADPATLNWNHPELGPIAPYFNREDSISYIPIPPRSFSAQSGDWETVQRFDLASNSNEELLQSLMHGTSGLKIRLNASASPDALRQLLKGVYLNMVSLHLEGAPDAQREALKQLSTEKEQLTGSAGIDAVRMAIDEKAPMDVDQTLLNHVKAVKALQPRMRSIHINAALAFEAGAGEAFELAYAVHNAHTCLNALLEGDFSIDDAAAEFQFTLSAGQSYFVNLAKFRALRYLWAKVVSTYSPQHDCSLVTWIHGETSQRQYGLRDVHTNLLRNTTAAMAAIAGGCDSLEVTEHIPWAVNEDTRRWARNIHHLLRDESGFGLVIDQASASPYIELLTSKLIEKALDYIRQWEAVGGITTPEGKTLFKTTLQAHKNQLIEAWLNGDRKVVGTNIFPPKDEAYANEEWPIATESLFDPINCASILKNKKEA